MEASFEKIHAYYQSLNLHCPISELLQQGDKVTFPAGEALNIKAGTLYLVTEGSVAISDAKHELTIGNTIEYMPIGLMEHYCPLLDFSYKCMTDVKAIRITVDKFESFFYRSPQAMKALSTILVFMTVFSLDLHSERKRLTSYQTIKPMLYRYLYRARTFKNEKEGLANFIIRRTKLSRTHVFRVLSELKQGGYITVKNGKLLSIDKVLPEDY